MSRYKGEHLLVRKLGFSHHGIGIGNGQVIHYGGKGKGGAKRIRLASLSTFAAGDEIEIRHHSERRYNKDEAIERAERRLAEENYDILFNNCEHFVNWCIDGREHSPQVSNATLVIVGVAAAYWLHEKKKPTPGDVVLAGLVGPPGCAGPHEFLEDTWENVTDGLEDAKDFAEEKIEDAADAFCDCLDSVGDAVENVFDSFMSLFD